VKKTDG